jgi:DNA helicase-2/ATP-dependent DNA helicase PcrA
MNKELFYRLSEGIDISVGKESIRQFTLNCLENEKCLNYDDAMAMLYLKVKMCYCDLFNDIRQTLVDEAQDYYPIQYEILKELFRNARFTVLGDVNQSVEKDADMSVYNEITSILEKKKHATIFMNKSFRCSYEISRFSMAFLNQDTQIECFERHGDTPMEKKYSDNDQMQEAILNEIDVCRNLGFGSIAVICKSMRRSELVFEALKTKTKISLMNEHTEDELYGTWIMPVYLAKGLEFDAVIVCGTEDYDLSRGEERGLMYISCTRALHRLSLFGIKNM